MKKAYLLWLLHLIVFVLGILKLLIFNRGDILLNNLPVDLAVIIYWLLISLFYIFLESWANEAIQPTRGPMDYIREFDIRLEKEMYYAGETVYGVVILDTLENFKLRGTCWLHLVWFSHFLLLDPYQLPYIGSCTSSKIPLIDRRIWLSFGFGFGSTFYSIKYNAVLYICLFKTWWANY